MTERIRVLVIDEDPLLLEAAKERLQIDGAFDVHTTRSGGEGLKLLRGSPFDAVISAYQMQGTNGLELLRSIRAIQPKMTFVLLAADGPAEAVIEALNNGADGYFQKDGATDSTFSRLAFRVKDVVESRRTEAESSRSEALDRQRALDELADTANKLSLATRAGAMGIWEWDVVNSQITWDEQMFALYGRTSESLQISYHAWISSLHPEDAKDFKDALSAALRGDEEFDNEFRVIWPDRTVHYIRGIATVVCDKSGRAVRMLGANWDVTGPRLIENALRESQEKYLTLFENMLEGFAHCRMLFDENGVPEDFVHLDVNPAFDQIMGTNNVVNRRATEVFPGIKEAFPELFTVFGRVAKTRIPESFDLEFFLIGKWLHISAYSPAREFFVAVFEDITLREQAEATIVQIKANSRQIMDNVNDGVILNLMLPDGRPGQCVECNEVACQMLGYSYEELLSMNPSEYDTGKHDPLSEKTTEELRKNGHARFRTEHRRKDGSMLPVEVNAHAISMDGKRMILAAIRDVTEGKNIEEALLQTNKNLNILTSITRHDTLNQIIVIQGYANLLGKMTLTPKQAEYVSKIEKATQAIQGQVEFTRQYQDIGAKAPKWQSIHETILKVKAALPLMTLVLREKKPDYSIRADPMFEKVIYNLIENCIRHSGGAKNMHITATEKDGSLHLVLEDDGIGIAPADREHLFERGFGKNTGYGLFLSREILKITNISIDENSAEGKGARFEIVVPPGEWRISEK